MPNWCSNALIVTGDETEVDSFLAKLSEIEADHDSGFFNKFVETTDSKNWYDEHLRRWGTKWDVRWKDIQFINRTHLVFDTAWSPPLIFVAVLSELYPKCKFEIAFSEMGMAFAGAMSIENGEQTSVTEVLVDGKWDEATDDYIANTEWQEHMDKYSIGMGG